jgi:hypothetical protein
MNHSQVIGAVIAALAYPNTPGGWCCQDEVEFGSNRFDVVAIKHWGQTEIRAYECKCSQGDLDRELSSGKWGEMARAGAAPYLAVASDLKIRKADFPPGLGLARVLDTGALRHEIRVPICKPVGAPGLLLRFIARSESSTRHTDLYSRTQRRLRLAAMANADTPDEQAKLASKAAGGILSQRLAKLQKDQELVDREDERVEGLLESVRKRERAVQGVLEDEGMMTEMLKLKAAGVNSEYMLKTLGELKQLGIDLFAVQTALNLFKGNAQLTRVLNSVAWFGQDISTHTEVL